MRGLARLGFRVSSDGLCIGRRALPDGPTGIGPTHQRVVTRVVDRPSAGAEGPRQGQLFSILPCAVSAHGRVVPGTGRRRRGHAANRAAFDRCASALSGSHRLFHEGISTTRRRFNLPPPLPPNAPVRRRETALRRSDRRGGDRFTTKTGALSVVRLVGSAAPRCPRVAVRG